MNNKIVGTVIGLIVVVLVWCGYLSWQSYRPNIHGPRQAIFLTDGQTYFGYASSIRNQTVVISDVYYLQPTTADTKTATAQQVTLVKLGQEVHGPTDRMVINRDNIKFIEDMKSDSQVNQKITDYLNKNKAK